MLSEMAENDIQFYETEIHKNESPVYFEFDQDEPSGNPKPSGKARAKERKCETSAVHTLMGIAVVFFILIIAVLTIALIIALGKPQNGWVYTRWGRPDCNEGSDLVYSGIAAGSRHRDLHGGGANQLCVPNDPEFVNPVAGEGESRAFLYSLEYQISEFPLLQPHHLFDVSCAVCKANRRHSHVMIPGRNSCPSNDWTLEYQGYLMAERSHEVHHKSMFICVDRDPIPIPDSGGEASVRAALLDLVEPKCSTTGGGLPCDKFTAGYEFTCVVCTL